ncbi:uncharacterized protein si:ch211-167b20.8 [Electrophorus electricus]|uniref:uncharacterized protein si:ch211-167b20.8 n=1 Tax=Electrophorus electricus TaxID=8005 RepID=UPI0015CFC3CC|nr:uncharacterized protein si:ch211-167b20.8 [Electrophorus electricus]
MAQGNNFLTIPEQEGLFTTTKSERSGEDRNNCLGEDEDDDEAEDDVRIIPRSSPIPRKRGHSINDETAEYMRIRLVLPPRRVSFADTTGADLVDVREFVPFDSDDEDDARWEEEETKYHEAYREPVYRLCPEFQPLTGTDLLLAVRTNKVEVESLTPVPDEPLSFEGLIRVLNISFHKSVYVRSTMDGWITYFDYPADYVQGSNDGETDKFSFRLSFAEPYLFNGARIDFVVRYKTSDGEFWANNSGRNYSVTLLKSYEGTAEASKEENLIRGILKPPRYSMEDDYDFAQDKNGGDVASTEREDAIDVPCPVCPPIEPEIDIQITKALSSSPPKTNGDSTPAEGILPSVYAPCEQPLQDSAETSPQINPPEIVVQVTQSLLLKENLIPSIQEVTEPKPEVPDNDQSSHSAKPKEIIVDSQSEISAKVHLDLDITLPAVFSSIQKEVEENKLEELKEVRGNEEKQSEIHRREVQKQDETLHKMEVGKPETSTQQCSFNDGSAEIASKDEEFSCSTHDTLFGDAQYPRVEECETETVNDAAAVRVKASKKEKMGEKVENVQASGEEVDVVAACTGHGFGVANLGLTGGDRVTHHLSMHPTTSEPEEHLQTRCGSGSEMELAAVLPADVDAAFVSENRALKEEIPTPEGKGRASEKEKPVSTIGDILLHASATSFQTAESQESQLSLSTNTPEVFTSSQPDVLLRQTLIPSIAFFSAAVCLVVGFQEPSIFLFMALLLCSLCL